MAMTDKQLVQFSRSFRKGLLGKRSSNMMCAAVCWPLAGLLHAHGVKCETVESDLGHMNHIWIKLADGRALDPTADQFNSYGFNDIEKLPDVYLGKPLPIHVG
jgi:hypothetical protein